MIVKVLCCPQPGYWELSDTKNLSMSEIFMYVRIMCVLWVCLCVLSVFFSKIFFCVNMCLVVLRIVLLLFLLLLFFCFQNDLFASCFLFDAFRCTCCSIVNVRWSTLQYMIDQQCNYLFHVAHKNIDHTSYIVLSPLEVRVTIAFD